MYIWDLILPHTIRTAGPIRILVTTPSAQPEIPQRASRELELAVHMEGLDSAALLDRVVGHPTSFDLVQLEFWMVQRALAAGSLQGIPVAKLRAFDSLLPLFTKGTVGSREVSRQGTPPHKVQYVDRPDSGVAHSNPTGYLSLAATVCNSDTLGWRPDRVDRPIRSWSDLFAADLRGRVALSRIASVSIVELALACEASGRLAYADKGNMTRAEIDATLSTLERAWIKGQFVGTWRRFEESVELMSEGAVALQSLWPPAVSALRQRGILLRYGMLEEGGRGWAGGFALASHLRGARRDAALDYINWYQSGWAGARLSRQGYYSATPQTARRYLTDDEWNYWYEGLPASSSILGPTGEKTEPPGSVREGGSFEARMGHVAVWSSRMDEDAYLQARWAELMLRLDPQPTGTTIAR
jgi:putative spermidine/putrescine transport system substrate-binding protein